jgi:hypothetical protein
MIQLPTHEVDRGNRRRDGDHRFLLMSERDVHLDVIIDQRGLNPNAIASTTAG